MPQRGGPGAFVLISDSRSYSWTPSQQPALVTAWTDSILNAVVGAFMPATDYAVSKTGFCLSPLTSLAHLLHLSR